MSGFAPDRQLAKEKYRGLADRYDRLVRLRMAESVRRQAVDLLSLRPGDAVLDVACGTGLSFALIEQEIGATGQLIGVDLSPEMLQKARERVAGAGWQNVTLVESAVEDADLATPVDGIFFHFTHDVMRSPAALENVFRQARPGARVVAAGAKRAPWWAWPVNMVMGRITRRYVTTFEGFERPWSHLSTFVRGLRVRPVLFGGGYIAWGKTGEESPADSATDSPH